MFKKYLLLLSACLLLTSKHVNCSFDEQERDLALPLLNETSCLAAEEVAMAHGESIVTRSEEIAKIKAEEAAARRQYILQIKAARQEKEAKLARKEEDPAYFAILINVVQDKRYEEEAKKKARKAAFIQEEVAHYAAKKKQKDEIAKARLACAEMQEKAKNSAQQRGRWDWLFKLCR